MKSNVASDGNLDNSTRLQTTPNSKVGQVTLKGYMDMLSKPTSDSQNNYSSPSLLNVQNSHGKLRKQRDLRIVPNVKIRKSLFKVNNNTTLTR